MTRTEMCSQKLNGMWLSVSSQSQLCHTVSTYHNDGNTPSHISDHSDGGLLFGDQHWGQSRETTVTIHGILCYMVVTGFFFSVCAVLHGISMLG